MHKSKPNYMQMALDIAKTTSSDVPVGCVIVKDDKIIAQYANEREKRNNPSAHAEMLSLQDASDALDSWRLEGCDMYVTLEPCPMCAWAILNSRISKLYFGAYDLKYGALGSRFDLREAQGSKMEVYGGIMEEECTELIKNYFKNLRQNQ